MTESCPPRGPTTAAGPVLVMAPVGRDASVLCGVLRDAQIECIVGDHGDAALLGRLGDGADAVLITADALTAELTSSLSEALLEQPAWSDLPVILLVGGDPSGLPVVQAVARLRAAGNVTILERPVRALTLMTAVQAALRARGRQHQIHALMHSERMARLDAEAASRVKDDFLSMVSHDLRTPLGSILLWTQLLLAQKVAPELTLRALKAILRSAQAQTKLVDNLLDASRIRSGTLKLELRPLDVTAVARSAVEVLDAQAQDKSIELVTSLEEDVAVRGDAMRLQQVLWNLLSNAIGFTPTGGRVELHVARRGHRARIEVRDNGAGIPAELLPQVFERFRQGHGPAAAKRGGLGLGLTITRELVMLHGGTIEASSPGAGHGAVFTLELPLAEGGARVDRPLPSRTSVSPSAAKSRRLATLPPAEGEAR